MLLPWLQAALAKSQVFVLIYLLGLNFFYFVLFVISIGSILRHVHRMSYRDLDEIAQSHLAPPISIIVPAYNEAVSVVSSVKSLFQLNYSEFEIIVINDGSTDDTLEKLIQAFKLSKTKRIYHQTIDTRDVRGIYASKLAVPWAELVVVDKENGGKADALNAGINVSKYPLFCSVDADSMLERDALLRVALPFMERAGVVGVGGIVRVANGCFISHGVVRSVRLPRQWLPCFQAVEYLRAFLSGRIAWARMNSLPVLSGAFSLFRKAPVVQVKGYDRTTVGEDMELVVRLQHELRGKGQACDIDFIPDPVCWTEVPEKLSMLWRQRNRWQRGLAQSLYRHLPMLLNPRFGLLGVVVMPYFWFVELMSPLMEVFGYFVLLAAFCLGSLQWKVVAAFLLLTVAMGINLSLLSILLEEFTLHRYPRVRDLMTLSLSSILENLGYRQMLALARLVGMLDAFRAGNPWGFLERQGLDKAD
ncbi:MAG: hypothetical protein A2X40_08080 [Elusimicrobia bacterium GWC2_65_9]|nr:MAG: hypothetical protein A2X37_09510 [Elusimicrobia bacterium GWA2_66_18]OGR73122.1 MAG: hypothetical protein A2X40_08080 [Elusimicrobia bacterium GWC2_65_9]